MDPSNNQIENPQLDQQEAILDTQVANSAMQLQTNNTTNQEQNYDMNGLTIQNNQMNSASNQSQAPLPQLPPPPFNNAPQQVQQQNSLSAASQAPISSMANQNDHQTKPAAVPIEGDKEEWDVAGIGAQQASQLSPQREDQGNKQNMNSIGLIDQQHVQQQNAPPKCPEDYLAQQKQMTVGLVQPAPYVQQQPRQSQMDEQAIENRLIEQDNQSLIDSNTTSNLNLDSGTVKDNKEGNLLTAKHMKQIDPFQNFDYDKNQSKFKDDEVYPDPPSFLRTVNDKTQQESHDQNMKIQESKKELSEVKQALEPIIQQSSLMEEQEQRPGTARQTQGLPQPYEPTVYYDFKDFPDLKWEPFKDKEVCPPNSFFDARSYENNGDKMENLLKGGTSKPILFDLQNTWLKGEQYAHILQNQDRYCQTFGIHKYDYKQHPESIYIDPKDGLLYFVQGESIGSDFGFPRLGIRKRFKWKKMNFTTDLPKRDPLVSYIVASAVKCEKFFPGSNDDGPVYRMHAVILKKRDMTLQLPSDGGFDVVSVKKNDSKESQEACTQNDKQSNELQPRSKHGRVLTKSTKLKAAQINQTSSAKKSSVQGGGTQQYALKEEHPHKNYILCHVRRVMGKRDEEQVFDSDGNEESPVKKETSQAQIECQKQQCSKIPNKGKNKFDQIPLQFSEELLSPGKDKKIPNLKMFQGLSLDQIKKMKVGPDGKPLSLYKIKKYILPYNKMLTDQQNLQAQMQLSSSIKDDPNEQQERDEDLLDEEMMPSEVEQSSQDNSPMEPPQQQSSQLLNQNRGRKRKNNQPIQELEKQVSVQSGGQVKPKSKVQNTGQKQIVPAVVVNKEPVNAKASPNMKKQISVEMIDDNRPSKVEASNNNQKMNKDSHNDQVPLPNNNQTPDQTNHLPQENNNQTATNNNTIGGVGGSGNQFNGLGNQGQFNLNNIDQALTLSLLNNGNNFGLNNLGLQNAFNGVNGLMFNQLNALQNLNAQQQNNLNSLLGANPNNLGLNVDLSLQNQLLGFNNNLGLNNFGNCYGLNGINNLLNMNQLQNMNLNGLLGQNPLNNLNTLQLQQNLLNQNGSNSQLISKLQEKLNNSLSFDNQLLMMNQQNNGGGANTANNNDNGLNFGDLFNASLMSRSKQDGKSTKKIDSVKQLEQLKNSAISPNILTTDNFNNNGVSPQLKNMNVNSTLMGLNNAFMNNSSQNNQTNQKRKPTQDNPNPFLDDLTNDLWRHCEKEYTRRLSGQMKFNPDDQKSQNLSPKSHNMSNFSKSPNIQPTQKLGDHLNHQLLHSNLNKRKKSMVSNFGRDRLNSNISAFQKFNKPNGKEKDVTTSPLIEGKQGEPSFGVDSIHDSKSIATLRPPKNSVEGSTLQNISKRNDSNPTSQNPAKGTKQQNQQQNTNSMLEQQQLLLQMQFLNQLPGQTLDSLNLGNLNPKLPGQLSQNAGGNSSGNQANGGVAQFNGGNNLQNSVNNQQIKGSGSQQNQQQQLLMQQQQIQQLLLYHCQQGQLLQNQLINSGLGMNQNYNPLDLLNQPLLQGGNSSSAQNDKNYPKNIGNILSNNKSGDGTSKNQQLNVYQNTHLQPVISGVIVNQFGATNGNFDNLGGMQCFQNQKESFRGGSKSQSPNIGGGQYVRSRGNSQKDYQFINDLKKALAPNPTNCGAQPQDQNFGGNIVHHGSSMIIPPSKQDSHRNSNVSQHNLMNFGARKSTDITPLNKHKFSITGVINPPSFHQNQQYNQNQNGQNKMNQQSQLSNNSNKLASSHPISQEQMMQSPDRNFDSSYSQKYESQLKMNLQQQSNQELMKSPGVFPAGGRTNQTSRRKQSSNFDNLGKQPSQHHNLFMQPISRHSGQIHFAPPSSLGPQNNFGEPNSGAQLSEEQQQKFQANNGKGI